MNQTHTPPVAVLFQCPHCCFPVRAAVSMVRRRSACPFCDLPLLVPTATNVVEDGSLDWPELPALVTPVGTASVTPA